MIHLSVLNYLFLCRLHLVVCTLNELFHVILTHIKEMGEDGDYIRTLQSKSQLSHSSTRKRSCSYDISALVPWLLKGNRKNEAS